MVIGSKLCWVASLPYKEKKLLCRGASLCDWFGLRVECWDHGKLTADLVWSGSGESSSAVM